MKTHICTSKAFLRKAVWQKYEIFMEEVKGSLNSMICSVILRQVLVYISQINIIASKPKLHYINIFLRFFGFIEKGREHKKREIFIVRRIIVLHFLNTYRNEDRIHFLAEKYWSLKQIREPRNSPTQRWSIDFLKEIEVVSGGKRVFFATGSEITGYL